MAKIKICGLMCIGDIEYANKAMPDYIGFVFAPGRKRTISAQTAESMKSRLDKNIKAVGVFLNNDIQFVLDTSKKGIIDVIQLHGDEDLDYIKKIRENTDKPIIRAVRVRNSDDIIAAENLPVDYLLLDTYKKGVYGGTGETFDWNTIPEIKKPYFLAGGINEVNISDALKTNAFCIDVSSGAETDGKKDGQKIINIVSIVKNYNKNKE